MSVIAEKLPPFGEMARRAPSPEVRAACRALRWRCRSPRSWSCRKPRARGVAAVLIEARHDAEDRIAPLAERHEVVEAFEDDVLFCEIFSVACILEPVVGDGLVGTASRLFSTPLSRARSISSGTAEAP